MGLDKVKWLLKVTSEFTFGLIAKQVASTKAMYKTDLAFTLVNSFTTSKDTLEALAKYPEEMLGSGTLDKLLEKGFRLMLAPNLDNLDTTLDLKLLTHFASTNAPFVMEVASRAYAARKAATWPGMRRPTSLLR